MVQLTHDERVRYDRQMRISDWGLEGQMRLKAASVFIAGAGGLGSVVAIYLAAAGVGKIKVCDADTVELSNLNRQILHSEASIDQPKVLSARRTLSELNHTLDYSFSSEQLTQRNIESVVGMPAIVVDCLDNFATRYVLNTYCLTHRLPLVHGGVYGLIGQVTLLRPPATPCLRCIFPHPAPPGSVPVVGVTPGLIGCLQAMEVLKYLVGIGTTLQGKLLLCDGAEMSFTSVAVSRKPRCPDCGQME